MDSNEDGTVEAVSPTAATSTPPVNKTQRRKKKSVAKKRPAKASAKATNSKSANERQPEPSPAAEGKSRYPAIAAAIITAEKGVERGAKVLEKLNAGVDKAIQAQQKAADIVVAKRQNARDKGTQTAKNMLSKAQLSKLKADDGVRTAKVKLREAKASQRLLDADLNRLRRAEQRLVKLAGIEEAKLVKKLEAEERRTLRELAGPRPKRRRKRRTKAEMEAARAAQALAASQADVDQQVDSIE